MRAEWCFADMWVAVECGRAAVDTATRRITEGGPAPADLAASTAKAFTTDAAVEVHGGIGFTWEHDAHIWLKRALLDRALYGSPAWHRRRVADAVLPAPVAIPG